MSPLPCHLLPPPCPPQWSGRWTTPWSSHSRQVSATKTGRLVQSGLECWQEPALDGRRRNQTHCRTQRTPVPPYLRMLSHNNSTKSLNARTNNNTTLWELIAKSNEHLQERYLKIKVGNYVLKEIWRKPDIRSRKTDFTKNWNRIFKIRF